MVHALLLIINTKDNDLDTMKDSKKNIQETWLCLGQTDILEWSAISLMIFAEEKSICLRHELQLQTTLD